jgi:hypothetical protein
MKGTVSQKIADRELTIAGFCLPTREKIGRVEHRRSPAHSIVFRSQISRCSEGVKNYKTSQPLRILCGEGFRSWPQEALVAPTE